MILASLLTSAVLAALPPAALSSPEDQGVWPLDPEPTVLAHFAPPEETWGAGHRGVDLAGTAGQVVRSALDGTVAFVGTIAGKPVVTVRHGARRTTYEPVVGTAKAGDHVAAGDPVGRLALTSSHCFPAACLHWGLREGDEYLDPLVLVGGHAVRLLPLWRDTPVAPDAGGDPWRSVLDSWHPWIAQAVRRVDEPGGRPAAGGPW